MADFIQTTNNKTATRELASKIADAAAFDALVQDILDTNPWGCTPYNHSGTAHDGTEKQRENYTAKVVFENDYAKIVGSLSAKTPNLAAFNSVAAEILGNTELATAMDADAVRDSAHETYSCTLKCHAANGEIYFVHISRDKVRISSYEDDAILNTIETWADGLPALA